MEREKKRRKERSHKEKRKKENDNKKERTGGERYGYDIKTGRIKLDIKLEDVERFEG